MLLLKRKRNRSCLFLFPPPLSCSRPARGGGRCGLLDPSVLLAQEGTKKEAFSYLFCYTIVTEAQTLSTSRAVAKKRPLGGMREQGVGCDSELWLMMTRFRLRIETAKVSERGTEIFPPQGFLRLRGSPFIFSPCDSGAGDNAVSRTDSAAPTSPPPRDAVGRAHLA